jgi:hypothetical protein
MGCITSKHTIDRLEDSMHVALKRDKKKRNTPTCFVPRATHPLLVPKKYQHCVVDESTMTSASCNSDELFKANAEAERFLYHTAHHCDTVDPRDFQDVNPSRIQENC